MLRKEIKACFGSAGAAILPVVHVLDNDQAARNVEIAMAAGAQGVFLINHDFEIDRFLPIIRHVRRLFPDLYLGVNFLAVTGKYAFPILANLQQQSCRVDAYWADDARIDENAGPDYQIEAEEISDIRIACGWNGLYFGGAAFKKQRRVGPENYGKCAEIAMRYMDVVTTSGIATGQQADIGKIDSFRRVLRDSALALASGITPENAHFYSQDVDVFLVATGINVKDDFYNIDPRRLEQLIEVTRFTN